MQDNLEIASAGQKQDTLLTGTQTSKQSSKERNRQNVANFRARQRIITQLQEEVYLLKKSKEYLEEERLFLNQWVDLPINYASNTLQPGIWTSEHVVQHKV